MPQARCATFSRLAGSSAPGNNKTTLTLLLVNHTMQDNGEKLLIIGATSYLLQLHEPTALINTIINKHIHPLLPFVAMTGI